ncbi:hypothetical protein GCG54_00008693 [Colletotrichum gloeosporioides]|uniref:Zn(2)-C6 fungal-type domain-containing protein n=1 Tax=Colletotrichum gloeosporioides TaxID=474922 RepID=A0A8H4CNI6_COLGL|nr:uncharacterized protein GCG54_00008693 [Colletotrichum gloeosporioides]KAF3807238.1 hypothetical protein GCG54_00008693 [Colletotrichum gloeosporioides]
MSSTDPSKRTNSLACERCRAQKLRCDWPAAGVVKEFNAERIILVALVARRGREQGGQGQLHFIWLIRGESRSSRRRYGKNRAIGEVHGKRITQDSPQ